MVGVGNQGQVADHHEFVTAEHEGDENENGRNSIQMTVR